MLSSPGPCNASQHVPCPRHGFAFWIILLLSFRSKGHGPFSESRRMRFRLAPLSPPCQHMMLMKAGTGLVLDSGPLFSEEHTLSHHPIPHLCPLLTHPRSGSLTTISNKTNASAMAFFWKIFFCLSVKLALFCLLN